MRHMVAPLLALFALAGCAEPAEPVKDPDAAVIYQEVEGWQVLRLSEAVESPHPYQAQMGQAQALVVRAPKGARQMKLLFSQLDVEPGHDEVIVLDGQGQHVQTLSGQFQGWSQAIGGEEAVVLLKSDDSVQGYGFQISAIQFDLPQMEGRWRHHGLPREQQVRTAHPYEHQQRQSWTLEGPADAQALRVRFSDFSLERGYDFVNLYDAQGAQVASYTGRKGPFVSAPVPGSRLTLELITDGSVNAYGFEVAALDVLEDAQEPAGCQSDQDCGQEEACQAVQCIRAPCPAMCVPRQPPSGHDSCVTSADCPQDHFCEALRCLDPPCGGRCLPQGEHDPANLAEPCHEGRGCAGEARCVADLAGQGRHGICAVPVWSRQELARPLASEHPYEDNQERRFDVELPSWVERFALHLDNVDLEEGYDHLYLHAQGQEEPLQHWTGSPGDVMSELVEGHQGWLRLVSDYSVGAYGFEVHSVDTWGLPQALVPVFYEPQQCARGEAPGNAEELRAYLRRQGLTLYGMRVHRAHRYTCRGCHCPTGYRYVMALSPADAATFLGELPLRHKGLLQGRHAYQPQLGVYRLGFAPRQCGGNPWQLWASQRGLEAQEEPALLRQYLAEAFGVELLYTWSTPGQGFVCQACSCPRGDQLGVVLEATAPQLEALKEAGWVQ